MTRLFQSCGRYDGLEAAGKWLRKLAFDLQSAEVNETPLIFFQAVDLNFAGEASDWVDSSPQFQVFTEQLEVPTAKDVEDFKKAVQSRFPTKYSTVRSEKLIEQDLNNLAQEASEPLSEYYGRAQHLLRRTNTREEPSENNPLSTSEKVLL
ncbi:hypothetical protein K3495_g4461 [Podosphaera aphanis]|nr:hypothetical protein K3495_g4461 [Podosphaera aphanis]